MGISAYSKRPWGILVAGWLTLALLLPGCSDPGYALYAVTGQLALAAQAQPIQNVLDDGSLTDEQREKVLLILDIRDFAANDLGLNAGNGYSTYVDTGGEPVAYNFSATAKDSFTPVTWTFPFAGTIPNLGFFSLEEGEKYNSYFVDKGYDTVLYPVPSYSTGSLFPEPITTAMLKGSESGLADLIIHETTHDTIGTDGNTDFNENVAMFVAQTGAIAYLASRHGADSDIVRKARHDYEDSDLYNEFLTGLFEEMRDYYATDLSSDDKITGRAVLFEQAKLRFRDEVQSKMYDPQAYDWFVTFNLNNAWILLNVRYTNNLSVFAALYESVNRDFGKALQIFTDAARSDDPIAYLQAAAATN